MFGTLFRSVLLLAFAVAAAVPLHARSILDYVGQCVPFARAASGIQIYGDAWTWWDQAAGRYPRGHEPKVGAVLAFAKTQRLPLGHVLVVSRVVEPRVAMVTHANWSRINGVRGGVEQDVTVFDVSRKGDWTRVKVWYRDSQGLGGSEYPTHGFIYGPGPVKGISSDNPDYVGSLIDAYAR
ncbi:CHAP domain-containing protein [Sphingomonas sp. VNH70]|uniref:CHAP domain-containing protein n=1 Tax=Sphingomonas silueang TaxID=3156617 RepID=UPI0032B5C8AC